MLGFERWRRDFPAISNFPKRIYFDNAATTQKPQVVIDQIAGSYQTGVTALGRTYGELASTQNQAYDQAHKTIANFFGAGGSELIITPSATAALDLVVANLSNLSQEQIPGVALARHNHSSVLAPLSRLADAGRARVTWLDFDSSGRTQPQQLARAAADENICLLALPLVSNVFGVSEDLAHLGRLVTQANRKRTRPLYILVDAAAAVLEQKINFARAGVDFLVVSAHKMFGPHLGAVCVRRTLTEQNLFCPQTWGGGNVIFTQGHYQLIADSRARWRAGVPDLVGLLAWAAACRWYSEELNAKFSYVQALTTQLITKLQTIPQIHILGTGKKKHLVSFVYQGYRTQDVAVLLGARGVLTRPGQHCAQMLYQSLGLSESLRLSLAPYNTPGEVTEVVKILASVPKILARVSG